MTQTVDFRRTARSTRMFFCVPVLVAAAPALAQPRPCPLQGDATQALARELNPYKNREDGPPVEKINSAVTMTALLAPGDDRQRWSRDEGAIFEGMVVGVKVGGIESVNCHAHDAAHRDTHIELALSATAPSRQRVIVEVTPRLREKMAVIHDWSTSALKRRLLGHRVRITGWLFDDLEHRPQAENTNPGGARNWRATIWEIHPVTGIQVLPGAAVAVSSAAGSGASHRVGHHRAAHKHRKRTATHQP